MRTVVADCSGSGRIECEPHDPAVTLIHQCLGTLRRNGVAIVELDGITGTSAQSHTVYRSCCTAVVGADVVNEFRRLMLHTVDEYRRQRGLDIARVIEVYPGLPGAQFLHRLFGLVAETGGLLGAGACEPFSGSVVARILVIETYTIELIVETDLSQLLAELLTAPVAQTSDAGLVMVAQDVEQHLDTFLTQRLEQLLRVVE